VKLVLQIAAGIILASLIIWGGSVALTIYSLNKASEILEEGQVEREKLIRQRLKQSQLLKQKQIKQKEWVKQKRLKDIKKQTLRRKKVNDAWDKYYKELYNCKYPDSQKEKIWCQNYRMSEKKEFNRLLRQGKIELE